MRIFALILIAVLCFTSCGSSKRAKINTKKEKTVSTKIEEPKVSNSEDKMVNRIVNHAEKYEGVRYKYGGTSKKGMDCSGLVVTAFNAEDIKLPRTTRDLSKTGVWIDIKNVKKGDLLFFATKKNNRSVNHVGIVTKTNKGVVEFIHASSSKGVITSSLKERYWYLAYVQARRVL